MTQKTILAVLAHPDDETLGFGGTLAYYADRGVETHLICATRGQHGWFGAPEDFPGTEELGSIRENELANAARILNIKSLQLLDYMDGALDQVVPEMVIQQIATCIRRVRPQVVLTFDPFGVYGHPDHIAISQFATAAVVQAASGMMNGEVPPHRVDALYYRVMTETELAAYQAAFGDLIMTIDGVERHATPWQEWSVSTRIDTCQYVPQVWDAVRAHQSQLAGYERLLALPLGDQQTIFGIQTFYRAFSFTAGDHQQKTSLFPKDGTE